MSPEAKLVSFNSFADGPSGGGETGGIGGGSDED